MAFAFIRSHNEVETVNNGRGERGTNRIYQGFHAELGSHEAQLNHMSDRCPQGCVSNNTGKTFAEKHKTGNYNIEGTPSDHYDCQG